MNPQVQAHGVHVLKFGRMVHNFGRIGELTMAILEMLRSQDWRDYADATGEYHFLAGEFDYFLAEQAVAASDLPRLYLTSADKLELQAAMDRKNTDRDYRRALEAVVQAHPRGALGRNWTHYGWDKTKLRFAERALIRAQIKKTREEREQQDRHQKVKGRRHHLDKLIIVVMKGTRNETERRYIIDELQKRVRKHVRPSGDHPQWRRDVKRFKSLKALATHWGISKQAAYERKKLVSKDDARVIFTHRRAS